MGASRRASGVWDRRTILRARNVNVIHQRYRGLSWISTSYHCIRDCLEMLLNIIEYRGLSWISTSYHCIRDCLEMLLNIIDYRGLSWISTSYHRIRDCLEMLLNIIEYRGLSWISASYHRILGSQPRPKPAVTVPQAKWQSMPYLEVALNGISWIIVE